MIIGRKAKGRFSNQNTKTQLGSLKHSSGLRSLPNKKEDAENNKKKRALKRTATSQLNIGGIFSCLGGILGIIRLNQKMDTGVMMWKKT